MFVSSALSTDVLEPLPKGENREDPRDGLFVSSAFSTDVFINPQPIRFHAKSRDRKNKDFSSLEWISLNPYE